jgi:hypothetical protein
VASVAAVTAAIGLSTMCRTVGFIDRGELAAVACTLGVAHPTGYPTFTWLGHLASLAWPARPILALNAMAALWVAAGAAVMVLLFDRGLAIADPPAAGRGRKAPAPLPPVVRAWVSALAALFTFFVPIWWEQANGFEVYALHALLLPTVVWLFLRFLHGNGRHDGAWFALALGLSFTNHMTTILLIPALLVYVLAVRGPRRETWLALLRLVPFFAIGLLPYLWLPIRAAMKPRFCWGNPVDMGRFIDHVSAWQYRVWLFNGWEVFREQTGYFIADVPRQTAWAGAALALYGAWTLLWRNRALAALALLMIAATVLYAGSYRIRDIESYFMTAVLGLGLCAAVGLAALARRFGAKAALALGAAVVVAQCALHYRECDESGNFLAEDLTTNMLSSLPPRAIVFTTQWDHTLSPSWYLQTIEKLRPDVLMVDVELLRRTWYLDQIGRQAPWFVDRVAPEIAHFRRVVEPFERHRAFVPDTIEAAYTGMIDAMMGRHMPAHPIFVTGELPAGFGHAFRRIPWQLVQRVTADTTYLPQDLPRYRFRPWPGHIDHYVAIAHFIYGQALTARMLYERDRGYPDRALRYGEYALTFAPPFRVEDFPPMALEGRQIAAQYVTFFENLRRMVRGQ